MWMTRPARLDYSWGIALPNRHEKSALRIINRSNNATDMISFSAFAESRL
jgi:hypothetical protein